mmetsp:Transcript_122603/g.392404  ORF Transcript_122603/g.392404 Transcript_122603/m.392404 type:complete len:218 (+) Transcript_122603:671-1324(+)
MCSASSTANSTTSCCTCSSTLRSASVSGITIGSTPATSCTPYTASSSSLQATTGWTPSRSTPCSSPLFLTTWATLGGPTSSSSRPGMNLPFGTTTSRRSKTCTVRPCSSSAPRRRRTSSRGWRTTTTARHARSASAPSCTPTMPTTSRWSRTLAKSTRWLTTPAITRPRIGRASSPRTTWSMCCSRTNSPSSSSSCTWRTCRTRSSPSALARPGPSG